jgi:hypothetical protein
MRAVDHVWYRQTTSADAPAMAACRRPDAELGVTRVCVNADPDSPPAVPFYTSQGAVALNRYWYAWEDAGSVAGAGVSR